MPQRLMPLNGSNLLYRLNDAIFFPQLEINKRISFRKL